MINGIGMGVILTVVMLFGGIIVTILINILLAPIIKTPKDIIDEILESMKLEKEDRFLDLGCADGRVVLEAYKKAKCRSFGFDISPIMIIIARTKRILSFPMNKDIVFDAENIFDVSLKDFSKIYCYLDETSMEILGRRLKKYLKSGGEVFSYKYAIKSLKAKKKVKLSNGESLYIY